MRMWGKYNNIISISDAVTEGFVLTFPSLKEKVVKVENILPVDLIRQQADMFQTDEEMPEDGHIRLLSIGRFCSAKNYDNVPDITARLVKKGLNVVWYLIGFGGDEGLIRRKIIEAKMEKHVVLLGKKSNPYPYIKACDLYIQPSRYEGKSVTVREAQMLGKPVVISKYPTSSSQLENGVDGVIVPMDNQGCADGIAELLKAPDRIKKFQKNCAAKDYSNAEEINRIYQILDEE